MELPALLVLLGEGTRGIMKAVNEINSFRRGKKDQARKKIKELEKTIGLSIRYLELFHLLILQTSEAITECEFSLNLIEAHDHMPINMSQKVTYFGERLPSRVSSDIYVPTEMILLFESQRKITLDNIIRRTKDIESTVIGNSSILNQVDPSRIPALSADITNKLNSARRNLEKARIDLEKLNPDFESAIEKINVSEGSLREIKNTAMGYHKDIVDRSKSGFSP